MRRYKFCPHIDPCSDFSKVTYGTEFYLASEADAEIADMRAGFQVELASKDARIAELERYKVAVDEHNKDCDDRCGDAASCGYRQYFVNNGRRCPNCPVHEKIDL